MFWLLTSIFLGALGQIFFKIATDSVSDRLKITDFYLALAMNYNLWLGFISYGLSFLIWLRILTKFDLSYARPMVGLGYVVTVLLAMFIIGEIGHSDKMGRDTADGSGHSRPEYQKRIMRGIL